MCRCLPSGLGSSAHTRCQPRMSLKGPSRESVAAIIRNRESHRLGLAHCRRSSERLTAGLFILRRPWLWPPWRGWGLRPREAESLAPGHTGGEGIASSPGLVSVSIPPSVSVPAKSLQSCPTLFNPVDCSPPAPLSVGFSQQEYWNGLLGPPPGDLPDPGMECVSLVSTCMGRWGLYGPSHLGSPHIRGRVQRADAAASDAICRTGRVGTAEAGFACHRRRREVARR